MAADAFLTVAQVRAEYLPHLDRTSVWRRMVRWRADGFPLVEERARPSGGVELVVRAVELEAHLGLRACAA